MSDNNLDKDYQYSRETYYDLIEKGKEALDLAMQIAVDTEHPRAIEVLAGMLKNVSDANDKLMDLNKKHKDINRDDAAPGHALPAPDGTTVTNVFVGSTAELQKMIQAQKTDNAIDITPEIIEEE